jgi:hypothetical protein
MKKYALKFGLLTMMLFGIVSCKNKEKELADKRISELENFVDSLKTVTAADREANWDAISADYDTKTTNANQALSSLDETTKSASQQKIDASGTKYQDLKVTPEIPKPEPVKVIVATKPSANQSLRNRYFGAGKIGEDMNFDWVNKDNILKVYDNFFKTYKANKQNFSREDYDETKLIYEALDSRKNTVEKEGLSDTDNGKIASIKFKFAPMFKMNRIGAKSRENEEAKE